MSIQLKHNEKRISGAYKQKTKLKKGKACKHEPSNICFLEWNCYVRFYTILTTIT